jgi:predicted nuclease with TOPRIM domain
MERIVAEGRVICDAIDACETALNENNARLTGLCHALAEQEEKVEWFREQQDKICLSNTEPEEKNRELNESIKTNDGKVSRLGDRVDSTLLEENWMDRILPAGLQHGTSLGWAGN